MITKYIIQLLKELRIMNINMSVLFFFTAVTFAFAGAPWYMLICPAAIIFLCGRKIHRINKEIEEVKYIQEIVDKNEEVKSVIKTPENESI